MEILKEIPLKNLKEISKENSQDNPLFILKEIAKKIPKKIERKFQIKFNGNSERNFKDFSEKKWEEVPKKVP